ncbi:hypothetical protein [Actinomadura verrucosospora]|uniref:Uncharacterized protein n=1 Tax=Actinomadura verrucosospora TaxID=46165 RepID=A0A7D3ZGU0_ACTVE|nr:hypothetical protein [Actinomadura verrucosospora]QKG23257.1 hypothetical protein ACTIVE_4900 [Actinomadura verrucosospora]
MPSAHDRLGTALILVDGDATGPIHRSVLERVSEIGARLCCCSAATLGGLPASYTDAALRQLRRDLEEVMAFAQAARRTGWVLGDLVAAPGDAPVPVMDTPDGRLWARSTRGFELHGPGGARQITELPGTPGTAARTPLPQLIAPLAAAAARAELLEVVEPVG